MPATSGHLFIEFYLRRIWQNYYYQPLQMRLISIAHGLPRVSEAPPGVGNRMRFRRNRTLNIKLTILCAGRDKD